MLCLTEPDRCLRSGDQFGECGVVAKTADDAARGEVAAKAIGVANREGRDAR